MPDGPIHTVQFDLRVGVSPLEAAAAIGTRGEAALLLAGPDRFGEGWSCGPLLAIDPRVAFRWHAGGGASLDDVLDRVQRTIDARRAWGGRAETGLAVLVAYEAAAPECASSPARHPEPELIALSVDRSLRWADGVKGVMTERRRGRGSPTRWPGVDALAGAVAESAPAPRPSVPPATSLPRRRYVDAVREVKRHITRGDIYQANLCQRFSVAHRGDPLALHAALAREHPAPYAAFVRTDGLAVCSISPEGFVRVDRDRRVRTWPIKGTRPRGVTSEADAALARELLDSEKDRAELLMIVDLERNDLSRVCRTGTVHVRALAALRTYPTVHHLVAEVEGELRPDVGVADLVRATFPGGSITGAPKLRAMQVLRDLEPSARGFFTGSLFWFGDDGTLDSSILIRTVVLAGGRAYVGAGGGVTADSDPESEWRESNHKARALTRALGFEPEQAC